MALAERRGSPGASRDEERLALARQWRGLSQAATVVAVLTSPVVIIWLHGVNDLPLGWSIVLTFLAVIAFRGLVDLVCHRLIPRASLYGAGRDLLAQDVVDRRRLWYWRAKYRKLFALCVVLGVPLLVLELFGVTPADVWHGLTDVVSAGGISLVFLALQLPLLFFINFAILFGPMLLLGMRQMKGYEPGDADWGVKLEDIRGQAEPKEEVTRVISLWQAGDDFRKAGGKPERGLLFVGAPGTGKTMLSKGIATSFNSPIVTMPGSGFAQTFIGMDVIIVQILIGKARRLAKKWGGQCIIFIDEIDAVGLRRQSLGAGVAGGYTEPPSLAEPAYYGPMGARNFSGDLIIEDEAWREHLFRMRAPAPSSPYPPAFTAAAGRINQFMGGMGMGGMGGGMALNQLLVQMDGVDEPPFFRKFFTRRLNTFLDATYVVPQKLFGRRLRLKPAKPRAEQIYFIGATNVPLERLDPALIRPGRMGRHIWFRTPTKADRRDIFDLYLDKVAHVPQLDEPGYRDQLARITGGYSPAMIEQCCSMALTYAHTEDRQAFGWEDIVEAITTIESGTAQNVEYHSDDSRATAIHEAGHAVAAHLYRPDLESTRLSIRKRGSSLGHHQAMAREERFGSFRHREMGSLVHVVGAMAAEHEFYGETSTGVGGDVGMITSHVAMLVGMAAMGPEPIDLGDRVPAAEKAEREAELMERFERMGLQIMNRAYAGDAVSAILGDRFKREAAGRIIGQAYLTALCCMRHNRDAVAHIAQVLVDRKELYGDEVTDVLTDAGLERPEIDLLDEAIWPKVA